MLSCVSRAGGGGAGGHSHTDVCIRGLVTVSSVGGKAEDKNIHFFHRHRALGALWSAVSNLTSRAGELDLRSAPSGPDDRHRVTG